MTERDANLKKYNARRKMRRRRIIRKRITVLLLSVCLLLGIFMLYNLIFKGSVFGSDKKIEMVKEIVMPEFVDEQIITVHNTARTGIELTDIKNIVVHYVGNPNTTAQNNRDYFNKPTTGVSSHFLVGLEGEIIQCVPLYEKSAASNHRNKDTISIEVCHPDESGQFNEKTYKSLIKLTAWLCHELKLDKNDIIRHYDITGKLCPLYYVENEDEWNNFLEDVGKALNEYEK